MSDWFYPGRGCRQGDPISPYIFILCAEILAIMVRENSNIIGINIGNTEFKISQFADDTSIITDGSEKSLINTLETLKLYAAASSLHINIEKTKLVWIGRNKNNNLKLLPELNMTWDKQFTLLGIKFNNTLEGMVHLNYEGKIKEIRSLLNLWSKRSLTPIGKITVIKTLALAKLVHLMLCLPTPRKH